MENEEILEKNYIIDQQQESIKEYREKLQLISTEMLNKEFDHEVFKTTENQLKSVKSNYESLLLEVKMIYFEKDQLSNRYIKAQDKIVDLSNKYQLSKEENIQIQKDFQISAEKIKKLEEESSTNVNCSEQSSRINPSALETMNLQLQNELSLTKAEEKKLIEQIKDINEENKNNLEEIKLNYQEMIEKMKNDAEKQSHVIIREAELAVERIQSDKDQLQFKLNSERRLSTIH